MEMADGFEVRLARDDAEVRAAQALRYAVFIDEMGGCGPLVDHARKLETDRFDPFCRHMLLLRGGEVVGTYRLMDRDGRRRAGGFYSETEFDLDPLLHSGRSLLECGRSCLAAEVRGGGALQRLWAGLARLAVAEGIGILFGVASFRGADPLPHRDCLALLRRDYLAPPDLRVRARKPVPVPDADDGPRDRVATMRSMPALIKAYLRLGGKVGDGAFVDRDFDTTDVCMILDVDRVDARARARLLA